jgi:hypothetical protein
MVPVEFPGPAVAEIGWTLASSLPQFGSLCPTKVFWGLLRSQRELGADELRFCLRFEVWSNSTWRAGSRLILLYCCDFLPHYGLSVSPFRAEVGV